MFEKEFFDNLNKSQDMVDKWNETNDSTYLLENEELFRKVLIDFSNEFTKNPELNKSKIQIINNVESLIISMIPSYALLLRGQNNNFHQLDLVFISHILYHKSAPNLYLDVCNIFMKYMKHSIASGELGIIISFFIPISVLLYENSSKKLSEDKKIIEKLNKYIYSIVNSFEDYGNEYLYWIYPIILMISNYKINIVDFILNNKKITYLNKVKGVNKDFLYRLFENIFHSNFSKQKNNRSKIFHYTSLENLDKILTTKSLKFSKLKNLNDIDEGKMIDLENKENNIYSFSGTRDGDSYALFKSYTNLDGLSIEFDFDYYYQNLQSIKFISGEKVKFMSYKNIEFSNMLYFKSKEEVSKTILKWENYIKENFKSIVSEEHILKSIERAKEFINPIIKSKPWSYEKEFRTYFIFNPSDKITKNTNLLNLKYKKDYLLLNVPISKKSWINKIIIGPNMKKSEFHKEWLKFVLKKHGLDYKKLVEETKINIR